ncbi:MAG TPA: molybdopterin cofactor-binding domain-containing protein [Vicinamibacterales bacterium]|nr:molybdopterin cofactor-binding domain-containing protein [Vicinamibacterales bacterium]
MKTRLTSDARRALADAGFTRRAFLKGSGALIVTFASAATFDRVNGVFAQGFNGTGSNRLDSWIAIGQDGIVTAYTGKCDFGQGLYTAQMQLVAEELNVPFDRVRLIQCDTSMTPDQGTTSGQQSHPTNFNTTNLALAAATARETLLQLAAARFGGSANGLVAKEGVISASDGPSSRRVSYAELIGGKKFEVQLDPKARRKHPREWTVLGTAVARVDMRDMVTGRFEFVHNVRVPGMLHGAVVRPPSVGATVMGVDESSVRDVPGLVNVVVKQNFVGVVTQKPWHAMQAASRLKVSWSAGTGLPSQRDAYQQIRTQPAADTLLVDSGDVDATLKSAATVVRATYQHPYQMHGSIGSSCAVADVQGDKATLWSATQSAYPTRNTTATLLGLKQENVRVIYTRGAGCYGINGADTVTYDAAMLSQAVGKPVRVQLSRKDEMAWENYGNLFAIDQRIGLDAKNNIIVWDYEAWSAARGGRPGYNTPGNVVTGSLLGLNPAGFTPRSPAPPPSQPLNNGSNTAPSYIAGRVRDSQNGAGIVRSERVLSHRVRSPFFTGPLRAPERLQNTFAHESFMDEIAAHVKADPVEYRLRHLNHARLSAAIRAAAKAANWQTRPSPRPGQRETGVASGRGIACVCYEGDNGYVAMIADVDVDQASGQVRVTRLVVAQDCGPISNPDGMRNQIEGGAIQGMSRALGEEVTWDAEKVTSIDWRTYHPLPLGFAIPKIETVLINQPDVEACGSGETAITVVAAAIGNAIFDATGARIRTVPFTPERVKAALAARRSQSTA